MKQLHMYMLMMTKLNIVIILEFRNVWRALGRVLHCFSVSKAIAWPVAFTLC